MDNTYCPYCLHRMDKDELTDEGLRDELGPPALSRRRGTPKIPRVLHRVQNPGNFCPAQAGVYPCRPGYSIQS